MWKKRMAEPCFWSGRMAVKRFPSASLRAGCGDVEVLVAGAAGFAGAVAVNAMAGLDDAGQALAIEVDQVAWALVLVAHDGRRRVERTEPVHARPAQDAADRGAAEVQFAGDPPAVVTQPAKGETFSMRAEEVGRGHRRGRELRSPKPATPPCSKRRVHLAAVFSAPGTETFLASCSPPITVNRAFW